MPETMSFYKKNTQELIFLGLESPNISEYTWAGDNTEIDPLRDAT